MPTRAAAEDMTFAFIMGFIAVVVMCGGRSPF